MSPITLKTTLFPYQEECVQEIEEFGGRCLLACDMGLGKSLMALTYWLRHPEIKRAVIVCPASAQWHWEREARKHLGVRCEVLEGVFHDHKDITKTSTRLFILSYNVLLMKYRGELRTWVPTLKALDPGLLVFDECHLLCGRTTQRTHASRELAKGVNHVIALSGTPLTNRPSDLFPILNILRPKKWDNFFRYAHRFCGPIYNPRYRTWDFRGSSNIKELHKNLKRYVLVRRRKVDVLTDLPDKLTNVIPLDISNRQEYKRAVRDFLGWLKEKSPSRAARAARDEELTKVGYLLRLASEGKIKSIFEWIDNFLESGEKLLAFGIHEKMLDAMEEHYKGMCIRVDGGVIGEKRQKCFDQFNKSDRTRILFGNIDAAGTVWSCTSTSDIAFLEYPWAPGKLDQAIDRCRGVGRGIKGKKTNVWFLVAHGTVEERQCESLQKKQKVITNTLDGKKGEVETDMLDQLIEYLERGSDE